MKELSAFITLDLSRIPRYTTRRAWREIWRWLRIVNKRVAVEVHQCYIEREYTSLIDELVCFGQSVVHVTHIPLKDFAHVSP